jgi:HTH-type transcriptional regulator/antitoxin HigA
MATAERELHPLGDTDYAVPPGETLRELLEEQGLTQRDLARRADLSPKHVNRLLQGLVPLSADVATRLERVAGTPARIWNRLEADYQSDRERIRTKRELSMDVLWLTDLPVKTLVERDFLPAEPADKVSRLEQMLAFFGVASVGAWQEVYADLACAFRTTQAFEAKPAALATWLRLGELAAQEVTCEPFDRKRLEAALPSLRDLTREPPEVFTEKMRTICARIPGERRDPLADARQGTDPAQPAVPDRRSPMVHLFSRDRPRAAARQDRRVDRGHGSG